MTALKKTDKGPEFFENRIEESTDPKPDPFKFESLNSLCARFDVSDEHLRQLIAKHRIKKHPIGRSVRYRVLDLLRVIDRDLAINGEDNERT